MAESKGAYEASTGCTLCGSYGHPTGQHPVPYDQHERELLAVIAQRDAAYAAADALAEKVAAGRWIGEHTSENNPWQNALNLPEQADRG